MLVLVHVCTVLPLSVYTSELVTYLAVSVKRRSEEFDVWC